MAAALEGEGMEGLDSYRHRTNKTIQAFIKASRRHLAGWTAAGLVHAANALSQLVLWAVPEASI